MKKKLFYNIASVYSQFYYVGCTKDTTWKCICNTSRNTLLTPDKLHSSCPLQNLTTLRNKKNSQKTHCYRNFTVCLNIKAVLLGSSKVTIKHIFKLQCILHIHIYYNIYTHLYLQRLISAEHHDDILIFLWVLMVSHAELWAHLIALYRTSVAVLCHFLLLYHQGSGLCC